MSTDVHNHAIPRRVLDLVTSDSRYGVRITNDVWHSANISDFPLVPAWHDAEAKLREMDGKELDRAVLSAAPKPLYFYELELDPQAGIAHQTNLGLAEMCLGHEDRLQWMAHVPLAFPAEAAAMLRDAASRGASGVQVGTSAAGRRLDESSFDPFWAAVDDLEIPVFLHPAYEQKIPEYATFKLGVVVGLPAEVTVAVERLICARHFDRYLNLNVVAALGGGFFPYNEGRLRHYISQGTELADAPTDPWSYVGRLKFDSFLHDVPALEFLIKKAGAANVMIGTDCSFLSATPTPVADVRSATAGDEAAFEQVAETNAHDLFWQYGLRS
jgi:aminocarboxymuconate-semialdehyde decarboxylase